MTLVVFLYLFPTVLQASVFSVYIGIGNKLDLAVAFTVI